jgi:Ca-activated chloride channel family protein
MTFQWPELLWLLLTVPALVAGYILLLRRKGAGALRYSSLGLVREAAGASGRWKRHLPPALSLVALAAMIVALARPEAEVTLLSGHQTVILAMDISGSMRARDVEPSRFEAMQAAARSFVKRQPANVDIGVVAFAATANLVQTPTRNREAVLAAIDRFRTQRGTAVGSAILASLSAIFENTKIDIGPIEPNHAVPLDPDAPREASPEAAPAAPLPPPVEPGSYRSAVIILLTDGQTNTGPDPIDAARKAADLGVRIFTVGLGTPGGQVLSFGGWSMRAQLDEASLKTIADLTRGKYFRADSGTNLVDIYRGLGLQFSMEKQRTEITALFTALAAVLVLASALLSLLWFRRVF